MGNVRRFFRYDVEIPLYLQTVEALQAALSELRASVFPQKEQHRLEAIETEIEAVLEKIFAQKPEAMHVFWSFNQRLKFMGWLLDHYLDLKDPREATDFRFRLREDQKHVPPSAKKQTKLLPLMLDFYYQIDERIEELLAVAEHSYEGKIFIFNPTHRPLFEASKYVHNLEELAQKGVLPAQALVLLIEKFNLYVTVLNRLKTRYRDISDSQYWPVRKVNLSAGGLSFSTNDVYEKFARFHIFMKLEEGIVVCEGRMVMVRPLKQSEWAYRVGVEFEFVPFETQKKITRFVQHCELQEAMRVFPEPVATSPVES